MDKSKSEKIFFDATDFVKKTNLVELQSNIPDINGLATKTTSTAVKIKYLMLVVQLKKTEYYTKISELEKKTY